MGGLQYFPVGLSFWASESKRLKESQASPQAGTGQRHGAGKALVLERVSPVGLGLVVVRLGCCGLI